MADRGAAAQRQFASSEERFRLLVESVRDYAIFMLDTRGFVTTWNLGAERIKGYTADEIIGQHFSRFYLDADARSGICERELEIASREGRFEAEGWRLRKDGSRMWANVIITAMRDADGELVGFSKVTRDLTERRAAEEARAQLTKAREAVRLRDEFISIVSHELRTPLSTLRIQADGLHRSVGADQPLPLDRLRSRADRIRTQVGRLERLVTALLDVSRIESGGLVLDLEEVDLAAGVRESVAAFNEEFEQATCRLTIRPDAPVVGRWDPARLDQVLTNLLTNAAKYGAKTPIEVTLEASDERVTISVMDQGIGIAPRDHERIFGRFERAADVRHFGGLGLGLWLSRQIVEAHGGTVRVASSALGAGATFTVELPRKR